MSLIPSADNSYDLGSSSNRWKDLYVATYAKIRDFEVLNYGSVSYIKHNYALYSAVDDNWARMLYNVYWDGSAWNLIDSDYVGLQLIVGSRVSGYYLRLMKYDGSSWSGVLDVNSDKTVTPYGSIIPSADNSIDLGSSSYRWKDLYAINIYTNYIESGLLSSGATFLLLQPVDADSSNTLINSPVIMMRGKYWDGSASQSLDAKIYHSIVDTSPTSKLIFEFAGKTIYTFSYEESLGYNEMMLYYGTNYGEIRIGNSDLSFDTNTRLSFYVNSGLKFRIDSSYIYANQDLIPYLSNTYNLGSSSNKWCNFYVSYTEITRDFAEPVPFYIPETGLLLKNTHDTSQSPRIVFSNSSTAVTGCEVAIHGDLNYLYIVGTSDSWSTGSIYARIGGEAVFYVDVKPNDDNACNLGSDGERWSNIYAYGSIYLDGATSGQLKIGKVADATSSSNANSKDLVLVGSAWDSVNSTAVDMPVTIRVEPVSNIYNVLKFYDYNNNLMFTIESNGAKCSGDFDITGDLRLTNATTYLPIDPSQYSIKIVGDSNADYIRIWMQNDPNYEEYTFISSWYNWFAIGYYRYDGTNKYSDVFINIGTGDGTISNSSMKINVASVYPTTDNFTSLGTSSNRWSNLYAVNIYAGDINLDNGWKISELPDGVVIKNAKGEVIFEIREDGLYWKGKKIGE